MFKKPFVVLDLETSGVDPKRDDIIEVGMVRYENGEEVGRYNSLIKIDYKLSDIITIITGITDFELEEHGKDRLMVFKEVEKMLSGAYLVAHNSDFDAGFLKAKGVKLDVLGYIDTIPLAQILIPEAPSYSLESLTDDLGISHTKKHRAMGDVEATLDLFKHLWHRSCNLDVRVINEINDYLAKGDWEGGVFFENDRRSDVINHVATLKISVKNSSDPLTAEKQIPPSPLEPKEILGDNGWVKRVLEQAEKRPQQEVMSEAILSAFQQKYHLVCEAPTGVGKSLAYLSAAAHMAISNKSKVVISTNTINLQEQLFQKDIPLLQSIYREATGHPGVRVALLKGRSHYLCLRRLAEFKRRPRFSIHELILLIKILVWESVTQTGDSSEIHLNNDETLIWNFELSADQKFCIPQKCKPYGKCYLQQAREAAEAADLIIVNHALLCADLESDGGLLPDYHYLVVDEAHHFDEVATVAFGKEMKQESLSIPVKTIRNHLDNLKRRFSGNLFLASDIFQSTDSILDEATDLEQSFENFFSIIALFVSKNVPNSGFIEHLLIDKIISASEEWFNVGGSFEQIHHDATRWISQLRKLAQAIEVSAAQHPSDQTGFMDELLQEIQILNEELGHMQRFFVYANVEAQNLVSPQNGQAKNLIRWITSDMKGVITMVMAPLILGEELKKRLYDKKKSVIFTSATLGVRLINQEGEEQDPFAYLRQMLGLDERFETLVLPSPFNFEAQSYVITPSDLHPVQAYNSIDQVADFFQKLIRGVGGSMMGLFTSHGALEKVYLHLMQRFTAQDPKVLAQRLSGGRAKIMKAYLNDPTHSVLLGTNSFWEGVDIQGEALTTLVIHKLPFDVPNDPIFRARSELFTNSFMEYSVPRAILRFRQGFGRLIRSKKDYGVLIVLDNRVLTKDYGKMFLQALPKNVLIEKMKLAEVPDKVKAWLDLSRGT